jgi:hypothetical protein
MKLAPIVALLVSVIVQACSANRPTNSDAVNSRNINGAKTAAAPPQCDPNYSGCVPIASDVDCAGGKGNGPAYVKGPVKVIGKDIYGLDKDRDGIGCE